MEPNPYEKHTEEVPIVEEEPVIEAELVDPIDEALDILPAEFDLKWKEEEKAKCFEKIFAKVEDIKKAFDRGEPVVAQRALTLINRLINTKDYSLDRPSDNSFTVMGAALFAKLRPKIEEALGKSLVRAETVLDGYYYLTEIENPEQVALGVRGIIEHINLVKENLMDKEKLLFDIPHLAKVLKDGKEEDQQKVLVAVLGVAEMKIDEIQFPTLIATLYASPKYRECTEPLVRKFIEKHNLPFAEIYSAWKKSFPSNGQVFSNPIFANLRAVQFLEKDSPGVCRFLWDEFQIADFGRYPAELLLKQREEFDSKKNPYGVIVYPFEDWKGSFYHDVSVLKSFFEQLGGEFSLRVFECEGKVDIVRALRKCDELYNPPDGSGHKISLFILGGHGDENSITFGGYGKRHVLFTKDLARKVSGKAGEYLDENSTIILNSCSTGAGNGIGQELSKRFGAKVVAPKTPTNIDELYVSKDRAGKFRFNARYSKKEVKSIFSQGVSVEK